MATVLRGLGEAVMVLANALDQIGGVSGVVPAGG